jgi:MYXO-CTERM domain-containing protein
MFYVTGGGDSGHATTTNTATGGASPTSVADASMSDHVVHAASETVGGCGCRTSSHGAGEEGAIALAALVTATAFARRSRREATSRRRTRRDTRGDRSLR